MARQTGSANFAGTLEVLAGGPIDARTVVDTVADLTASGTFPYPYEGLTVYVKAVDKKYTLTADDPTVSANWVEDGSGGGGSFDLENATPAFTEASTRENIASGNTMAVILGKIKKFFTDLQTVAFSGLLSDLTDDATHRVVTDTQITTWNGKQNQLTAGNNIAITDYVVSTTSTYMANYTTEEQVIGTWIDGKPLYQISMQASVSDKTTIPIANISTLNILNWSGVFIQSSSNNTFKLNTTSDVWIYVERSFNGFYFQSASKWTGNVYITIQYTKTTDTATT